MLRSLLKFQAGHSFSLLRSQARKKRIEWLSLSLSLSLPLSLSFSVFLGCKLDVSPCHTYHEQASYLAQETANSLMTTRDKNLKRDLFRKLLTLELAWGFFNARRFNYYRKSNLTILSDHYHARRPVQKRARWSIILIAVEEFLLLVNNSSAHPSLLSPLSLLEKKESKTD